MNLHFLILTTLTLTSFLVDAQTADNKGQSKKEFKSQGEQEDYWAYRLFEKTYFKTHFDKFKSDIVINGDGFIFGDKTLVVINTPKNLKTVFSSGIFYPNIITGDTRSVVKSQAEQDTLSVAEKVFYNMTRTDSLTISDFEELKFLSNSPKYKRFKLRLWRKGSANPTACFIELTNENATDKTELTEFIIGASLTFFKEGWLVI
ncbi:hypothetical protein EXU57_08805 [Segetibacter sp. 3557_3]|uniref:hypothetical protein n=1 Tax=Segetibacter sp. 3557_3 TaxID=2547429 RepID=UPI001058FC89|nr:hypothetical protein [Segetibacter sp. 3557_3]TDH26895.1 hypothetical protein EXU57_08805 [Segetibacter sp. 3557_3]